MRRRFAPHVLPFSAAWESEIGRLYRFAVARIQPLLELYLRQRFGHRVDTDLEDLLRAIGLGEVPDEMLSRLFNQVDDEILTKLEARLPGISLPQLLPNAAHQQQVWVRQNVDLIKIPDRIKGVIERELAQPLEAGVRVEELMAQLQEEFDFDERRAELIARDQTLKLAGQIQEERQTDAGITRYTWTTSGDERVRKDHAELDGQVFSWDDPPIVNASEVARGRPARKLPPGLDFQCRCTADPIVDDPSLLEPEAEDET